jgi:xanthine dehydrogenase YagR molybdenum-binding subunit
LGRPLKVQLTRQQMQTNTGYQAEGQQTVRLGADKEGRLQAVFHGCIGQVGFNSFFDGMGLTRHLYAVPNLRVRQQVVKVNTTTATPMRPPNEGPSQFGLESALDELAHQLELDPLELRRRNFAERDPETGKPWTANVLLECYTQGAAKFGWERRNPRPGQVRQGRELIGMGVATTAHPGFQNAAAATVVLLADGKAIVRTGVSEIGGGVYTTLIQVAAQELGLLPEQVNIEAGDTTHPPGAQSIGSAVSGSSGSAVLIAARNAKQQLIQRAIADQSSPLSGANPEQIMLENGRIFVRDDTAKGEPIGALLGRIRSALPSGAVIEANGNFTPVQNNAFANQTFGVQFSEVRVDLELGRVRLARHLVVAAAGRILNEKTARSQAMGAVIYAVGASLSENNRLDPGSGRWTKANMFDYLVPVNADIPLIDVLFIDDNDTNVNPLGAKGIGELCSIGVTASIANAVFNATGKRVRELPITMEKLL